MRWWTDDSRPDLDARTDRLARRLNLGYPVERDTYVWASLRMRVALHESARAIKRELIPAVIRLGETMRTADAAMQRFGEAVRARRQG